MHHHNNVHLYQFFLAKSGWYVDHSKTVHTIYLQKIASCINLQLPIVILKKSTLSNMHHRKTYMYINFQQNRVSRSVKNVHTYLFAKNRKLHKFASNILKNVCANL